VSCKLLITLQNDWEAGCTVKLYVVNLMMKEEEEEVTNAGFMPVRK
jgi:hypothetical protein